MLTLLSRLIRAQFLARVWLLGPFSALVLLSACATHPTDVVDQSQEAAQYVARARGGYVPPGPPSDPWGPYIVESSRKYDVPERWIREVMRVESGGHLYQGSSLITSPVGAMGLMQVMPQTYDELRTRYELGFDAFDPHDNIAAGTAYLREMYDIYGSPGFLAAYNAGPKRLDDYLSNVRPLPAETRRYVSMIGPYVVDVFPKNRSPAEDYAMNELPLDIPAGLRYGRSYGSPVEVAEYTPPVRSHARTAARSYSSFASARLPEPPRPGAPPVRTASLTKGRHSFTLVSQAEAEPVAHGAGGSKWSVASPQSGKGKPSHVKVTGLSHEGAVETCQKMSRARHPCVVLAPNSHS